MRADEMRERFFEIHNNKLDRGPREKISDSELLMCFNGTNNRLQKASSIAEQLEVSTSTVRKRLKKLEEKGLVYRERIDLIDVWTLRQGWMLPWSENNVNYLERRVRELSDEEDVLHNDL